MNMDVLGAVLFLEIPTVKKKKKKYLALVGHMLSDHRDLVELGELVVVETARQLVGDTVDSRKDPRTAYDVVTFLEIMCTRFINAAAAPAAVT